MDNMKSIKVTFVIGVLCIVIAAFVATTQARADSHDNTCYGEHSTCVTEEQWTWGWHHSRCEKGLDYNSFWAQCKRNSVSKRNVATKSVARKYVHSNWTRFLSGDPGCQAIGHNGWRIEENSYCQR